MQEQSREGAWEAAMRLAQFLQPTTRVGPADFGQSRRTLATAALLLLTLATAACCIPFLAQAAISWTQYEPWLLAITTISTVAVFLHASLSVSVRRAALFATIAFTISLVAEYSGTAWNLPFGYRYAYDPALEPRIGGQLPVCVPPLWFVLAYTPVVFLRRMPVRAAGNVAPARLLAKAGLCALYLVATDLFLDPLGVSSGTWTWLEGGLYFGTPALNFVGWFLVGVLIYVPYLAMAREDPPAPRVGGLDVGFAAASAGLTLLCLAACVLRLGIWLPVPLAGAVLAPVWVYWLAGISGARPRRDP